MNCKDCKGKLEVVRRCSKVCLQCSGCGREYRVHEVADQLDPETEEKLSGHVAIIYD